MSEARPVKLLIAALGGEGGGVLASWIANAAVASGHFAQRTSIPGVAQRTGATTYYLEVLPRTGEADSERRPVLSLNPAPGEVDVMVASELLESVRAVQAGFVTPDRTVLVASTHRVFTVDEKLAMGDGRLDEARMQEIARKFARRAVLADFAAAASRTKSPLNAVLLGAIAATGALPVEPDAFRAAIRAEGKAVDTNLRGFEAGLKLGQTGEPAKGPLQRDFSALPANDIEARVRAAVPSSAVEIAIEGVRRLLDYQGPSYAQLYLQRLDRLARKPGVDPTLIREFARHLAVRMSFEDTIRVAQLKLKAGRIERLRQESKARDHDLIEVTEFLKPGPEEIFSLLPPRLGRAVLGFIAHRGWSDRSVAMRVRTTSVGGFLRLKLLAALKPWRPRTLRYAEEQAWIERWLTLVERAIAADQEVAREVVETARLVKGYGETYKRGLANWHRIAEEIIEPFLEGRLPSRQFADAVLQSRIAALADPDGVKLSAVIESVHSLPAPLPTAAE